MAESAGGATGEASGAGKVKVQTYATHELAERARNAWWHTRNEPTGFETFSDLVAAAIEDKVKELEADYNGGQPFPARPRRQLRSGRPPGR